MLSERIGSRDNNIDHLRLGAALAVVLGHSWHIALGRDAQVPLQQWTLIGFHSLAVHVFFFLSGLLVTQSAVRHANRPWDYVKKRALRIVPALAANAVLVPILLVLIGAWTGVGIGDMAHYAMRLVTMMSVQYEHPGAFADNPFSNAINGSVWSLRHEVIVYVLLIGASLCGALTKPGRRIGFLGLLALYVLAGHLVAPYAKGGALYLLAEGRHVMASFLLGVAAHQYAARVPLNALLAVPGAILLAAGLLAGSAAFSQLGVIWLVCAATMLIAFSPISFRALPHDVSYGVYIWSWPMQQVTVFLAAGLGIALSPMGLFSLCIVPLTLVSLASWLWIERPALSLAR